MIRLLLVYVLTVLLAGACTMNTERMVLVEGGSFMMGSEIGEEDEIPVRKVRVSSFLIDKYELRKEEFRTFINDTGYKTIADICCDLDSCEIDNWENSEDSPIDWYPVTCISWYDAIEYCNWLSQLSRLIS